MQILAERQYKSEEDAMIAARSKPMEKVFAGESLPRWTYFYVSGDAKIIAADVPSDATPVDEIEFIGRKA